MDVLKFVNSKTRKELLLLFFTNPEEKYYLRQLEKILKISPGTLHREIKNLEESGIIKSEPLGNSIFYQANNESPLYNEIKSIIFKTIGLEGSLKEIVNSVDGVEIAFIYGSFAKGAENARSDVDVLIIGEFNDRPLIDKIYELEKKTEREINYHTYTKKEWDDYKKKKDSFILGVIESSKIMLRGNENEL